MFVVVDELNPRKLSLLKNILSFQKMKYLKLSNLTCPGIIASGLSAKAERVCYRNVVFEHIQKAKVQSECLYLKVLECGGLEHIVNT